MTESRDFTRCDHDFRRRGQLVQLGPTPYETVCVKCWCIGFGNEDIPVWTDADYELYQHEVESRFAAYWDAEIRIAIAEAAARA